MTMNIQRLPWDIRVLLLSLVLGIPLLGAVFGTLVGALGIGVKDFWKRVWNSKLRCLLAFLAGEISTWLFFSFGGGRCFGLHEPGASLGGIVFLAYAQVGFCTCLAWALAASLLPRSTGSVSKHRPRQFSLKTLLAAPLVVALLLGAWLFLLRGETPLGGTGAAASTFRVVALLLGSWLFLRLLLPTR
jgi:hypothetical protein